MAKYDLLLADDTAMPAGHDWLFIRHLEGDLLVVRRSAIGPKMMHDLWVAARTEFDVRDEGQRQLHAV